MSVVTVFLKKQKKVLQYYLEGLYHRTDQHHVFLMSGGLAFSLFICIVPLVLVIFFIVGNILESSTLEYQITSFIKRMIPYSDYSSFVEEIISSRIEEVITHKDLAAYIGLPSLLFAASGLFSSMRTVLNAIYGSNHEESFVSGKAKDVVMLLVLIIFISLLTILFPFLEVIKDSASRLPLPKFTAFQVLIFSVGSVITIFSLCFLIYYFVPYRKTDVKTAALSALLAAISWEIAKQVFGFYITHFASLGKIYGTYVFIIVIAFWIYYSSLVFIIAAEIGQLYRERRRILPNGKNLLT